MRLESTLPSSTSQKMRIAFRASLRHCRSGARDFQPNICLTDYTPPVYKMIPHVQGIDLKVTFNDPADIDSGRTSES